MTDKYLKDSNYANAKTDANYYDSALKRWKEKDVKDRQVIEIKSEDIKLFGVGEVELESNFTHHTPQSIKLITNTDISDIRPRPQSKLLISLRNYDLTKFNRLVVWVYPKAVGFQNFYFHFTLYYGNGKIETHIDSLTPNEWNFVCWEIPNANFEQLNQIGMGPILLGCPPEAQPELEVYFDGLEFQGVDTDYDFGWELSERIAYCHSGYFIEAEKVALTQKINNTTFFVINENEEVVYQGKAEELETNLGLYYKMDFTEVKTEGNYYLVCDNQKTGMFSISSNPYERSIWKSINFLRMLRCGDDVEGVHSPCHLNSYTTDKEGRMVPNFGGWHDAGDVSQFEICTAEIAHSLLDLAERVKESNPKLYERLLGEARYGLNWLLRTRFGNGERALAVHYSIWHKNIIKGKDYINPESKLQNVSENGAYENFLAAGALAVAARMYQKDPVFAGWCLRSAIEDFAFGVEGYEKGYFSVRWGVVPEPQIGGAAALAAAELYELIGDEKYLEIGARFSEKILASQQSTYPNWKKPLRGFFYEDSKHQYPLTYEHRGHEQDPIQGLARLLEVAPHHQNAPLWEQGLKLYAEYIERTSDVCAPFNMLPAQIYDVKNIKLERFTIPASFGTKEDGLRDLQGQIKTGIRLDENIYLRRFPIAVQRRGYHATLLSKTKAVSLIARLFNNNKMRQIAINQLEWILGKNPFTSSTMYGEGYNFHPLYVAFSPQIVGSLPVGIKTKDEHDAPYWPVQNNAVYKEIWGHTTCKYLWVLADLI